MADGFVDLRSDTVTTPTPEMRRAMADAEVGDDCYGEDPTVNRLQELAAQVLGVEAAMLVPTGTMANQVAVRILSRPGEEIVCEQDCHLIHHESGATAQLSQVQLRGLAGRNGILDPDDVRNAIRDGDDAFQPRTAMVAIENTHNTAGGTVWPLDVLTEVRDVAAERALPVFCDGARLFNACVATGVTPAQYSRCADVVTISLYKGLAAPMGSLVCGSRGLVERAWVPRRIFGGALRQAGIIAAAGVLALQSMVERLADDHRHATLLAHGVAGAAPPGSVPLDRVQTNMVVFRAGASSDAILGGLKREGVLAGLIAPGVIRFVTHKDVDRAGIERAVRAFAGVMKELG